MAGKGQHYLPRFLLKGFASRTVGKESYVWVCKKGKVSYESNIQRIAKESYFYGKKGESDVDDKITKMEAITFSKLIDEFRLENRIDESKYSLIGDFVAHLVLRSKHTREISMQMGKSVMNRVVDDFQSPMFLQKAIRSQQNQVMAEVKKKLNALGLEVTDNPKFATLVAKFVEQFASDDKNLSDISSHIKQLGDVINKRLPSVGKDSQLKNLSKPLDSSERARMYRDLHWSVMVFKEADTFILGDVGPIVIYGVDKEFNMALVNKEVRQTIFLPISDKRLLVGTTEKDIALPNPEAINMGMAELCYEFFISSKNGHREAEYFKNIGKRNMDVVHEAIADLKIDDYKEQA